MKKGFVAVTAAVLVVSMAVCACGKKETKATFTGDKTETPEYQANLNAISPAAYSNVQGLDLEPGTYISIIGKDSASAYWKTVEAGVTQAAEDLNAELGYTGSDKIKVTYNAPAKTEDIDEQVNILDEELARYPDVIGIACIDADACTVQFDLATANGISIITLDSGNVYQGIQCSVSTDNADAARTGAYKLADEIGGSGEILLLVHDSESESALVREESFLAEIDANYPNVQIAETVYCDKLEELKKQIAEEANADLQENDADSQENDTDSQEKNTDQQEKSIDLQENEKISADQLSDEDVILYYLEQHPDIKGIFGTNNATTQLAVSALQEAEKQGLSKADEETDEKESAEKEADEETAEKESADEETDVKEEKQTDNTEDSDADAAPSDSETADDAAENTENAENDASDQNEEGSGENTEPIDIDSIIVMGFDAGEDQLSDLEGGAIDGLVVQNPFGIGYASVVAAARTVLEIGNEAEVNTGYIWVTKENMETESIQKMLYK